MLLTRQEEMLRQIQEEKEKLLKQEEMIRNRQQDRLKQVGQKLHVQIPNMSVCVSTMILIKFLIFRSVLRRLSWRNKKQC